MAFVGDPPIPCPTCGNALVSIIASLDPDRPGFVAALLPRFVLECPCCRSAARVAQAYAAQPWETRL